MQTLVERGCGLDVHQATVVACLLIVLKNGQVQKQVRTFGTTTRELMGLREWLLSGGCTHVAMESTGVYWKPIYAILEGAFEIVVAKSQHVEKDPRQNTTVSCCACNYVDSGRWKKILAFSSNAFRRSSSPMRRSSPCCRKYRA